MRIYTCLCLTLLLLCTDIFAQAQYSKHEWLSKSPFHESKARITNLKTGDVVETPFVVKFGVNDWGIAPAEHSHAMTGHHHLLIDTELPIPLDSPIPFTDKYRHFGKGQMEVILDLPAGKHTLRLLLANHKHVPYFVYSNAIEVFVAGKKSDKLPSDYGKTPRLEILSPATGGTLSELVHVVFHASGLNIAHADTKLADTGFFQLAIKHDKRSKTERISFPAGQTETWLKLPKGKVAFQLEFVKNSTLDIHEVKSAWVNALIQ
jgi:Domain of unknown function (DUF4399)